MEFFSGLLIALIGILISLCLPEVRRKIGLDPSKSNLTPLNIPKHESVIRDFYDARDFSQFVAAHDGGIIYLDIQIDEDDLGGCSSSFTLFEECFEAIPLTERPSVYNSTGTTYEVTVGDSAGDAQSHIHGGFYRLRGYFAVGGYFGPRQGLMTCSLRGLRIDSIKY